MAFEGLLKVAPNTGVNTFERKKRLQVCKGTFLTQDLVNNQTMSKQNESQRKSLELSVNQNLITQEKPGNQYRIAMCNALAEYEVELNLMSQFTKL